MSADLIPTNISLGSTTVVPGGSLFVNWSILNQGSTAANSTSSTEVRITSSPSSFGSPANNLTAVSTSALGAGASQFESATVTVPATPGTYYVWIIADNLSQVTQSNVSNDEQHSLAFTVSPPPPPPNNPPTATGHSQAVTAGTSIPLSSLFTYSDPDSGDSVTGFAVQDRSAGGGHLYLNGVQQADNVVFGNTATGIPISQIGQWTFVAGPGGSADTIGFSPIDSHQAFSNATATVTASPPPSPPNNPPTATGHSQAVTAGTSIPLSSLFTYSDRDSGDSVTGFAVQDRSAGGGHLYLNGVQQADNVVFGNTATGIPISQIGQWTFVAGPGGSADTIGFSPIDSHQAFSTAAATVTVSPPPPPPNPAPSLSNVSPSSYLADTVNHMMKLFGSNFTSGDTLTFTDPQGHSYASRSSKLTLVGSNEIDYLFNDGNDPGTWTVQVNSPDGTLHSGTTSFSVSAPTPQPPSPGTVGKGQDLINAASAHLGEDYFWHYDNHGTPATYPVDGASWVIMTNTDLDNPSYSGPWDCAEFVTYCVYRAYGVKYGLINKDTPNQESSAKQWLHDATTLTSDFTEISLADASNVAGAVLIEDNGGHVAISMGDGTHIIEADVDYSAGVGTYYSDSPGDNDSISHGATGDGVPVDASLYDTSDQNIPKGVDIGDVKTISFNWGSPHYHAFRLNNVDYSTPVEPQSTLPVAIGGTATISHGFLWSDDPDNTPAQLTYTIIDQPAHGLILDNGVAATSFTQADIDNGLVKYVENGDVVKSDTFTFTVSDPAGNSTETETFNIAILDHAGPVVTGGGKLAVPAGGAAPLLNPALDTVSLGDTPDQIAYTLLLPPEHGLILDNGAPATSFTQADIDSHRVQYVASGDSATSDGFIFQATDAAGNHTGPQPFAIQIGGSGAPALSGGGSTGTGGQADQTFTFDDVSTPPGGGADAPAPAAADMIDPAGSLGLSTDTSTYDAMICWTLSYSSSSGSQG